MSKLDEWAALAEKATGGEWGVDGRWLGVVDVDGRYRDVARSWGDNGDADAAFIAASRTALPAAIDALRWVYRWLDHADQHGVDAVTDLPILRDGLKEALDV